MPLPPGSRLGPYEIVEAIGAGGMGEVYRARDERLGRDVAVKVLPEGFARDADRLRRFEQEAKAAAALNHPNVVAVFDVGVEGDAPYVVSELLEGETLRSAVSRGALPPRKVIDVAVQTARGIAAAHQKGIVHRDLKPDNIFLTLDGRTKILDFGLAQLLEQAHASTLTRMPVGPSTTPGTVLGTVGYMSPEQVRGDKTDYRTDIFSFGVVVYEMMAGHRAFSGDSAVEIMTAILKNDPDEFSDALVPPPLDRIVRRCLEKNPNERFQSASDIAFAIEALSTPTSRTAAVVVGPPQRRWKPLVMGVALVASVALGAIVARQLAQAPSGVVGFEPRTFDRLPITNARFMPDGQTIVYSATPRGYAPDLFIISPNAEAPQPLGVSNAQLLSVSSKGELALITGARHLDQRVYAGTLARMTMGSSPRAVLENVREADWSPGGAELAVIHDLGNGRDRLEYPAGTALYEAGGYLSDLRVSPDGARVAFFEHQWRFDDRGWVKVVDLSGRVTTLTDEFFGLQGLAWSADGATVVFSGNRTGGSSLQPMEVPASGRDEARPAFGVPGRFIVYDVASDGRWLAVREDLALGVRAMVPGQPAEQDLSWLGSSGARGLSTDGQWLLMVDVSRRGGRDYGVVLRKTDSSQTIRLGEGSAQALSPDGKWASAIIGAPPQLIVYPTGAGEPIRIDAGPIDSFISAEWFPDSARLLVCGSGASRPSRCFGQDLAGSLPTPLTAEGVLATLAPDGRTLLTTRQDGSFELSTIDGGPGRPALGLRTADRQIAWSRDSRAVFVQQGLDVPALVERVELATGERAAVKTLAPEGIGSVATLYVVAWTDDGRWYAYNYTSLPSTLFVVTRAID